MMLRIMICVIDAKAAEVAISPIVLSAKSIEINQRRNPTLCTYYVPGMHVQN